LYDEKCQRIYNGAEQLVTELFSEGERMRRILSIF